ncbi:hypothetical protein KIPB_010634, partial [Kipferlia bialata]|eukprot:g10634.t1
MPGHAYLAKNSDSGGYFVLDRSTSVDRAISAPQGGSGHATRPSVIADEVLDLLRLQAGSGAPATRIPVRKSRKTARTSTRTTERKRDEPRVGRGRDRGRDIARPVRATRSTRETRSTSASGGMSMLALSGKRRERGTVRPKARAPVRGHTRDRERPPVRKKSGTRGTRQRERERERETKPLYGLN